MARNSAVAAAQEAFFDRDWSRIRGSVPTRSGKADGARRHGAFARDLQSHSRWRHAQQSAAAQPAGIPDHQVELYHRQSWHL